MSLLCVDDLAVRFTMPTGDVTAVRNFSFRLEKGESLAIVGESGSGKSQSMAAILGLLAENGRASGSVRLDGQEILNTGDRAMRRIRGRRLSVVFQDPMSALNPYITIGQQLSRVLIEQRGMKTDMANAEVIRMLDAVRVPAAKSRLGSYAHEFSGGMRQRVLIAAALLCRPDVLIADEPTTALDVTVQAEILQLLRELQEAFHTALILISHDLAVVAGSCDRLIVMRDGVAIEEGETREVFAEPGTDVTKALLNAVPRLDRPFPSRTGPADDADVLIAANNICVRYPTPRQGWLRRKFTAVRDVSLTVREGETLGIVGESGCGKSSLARALVNRGRHSGEISYLGSDLLRLRGAALKRARRDMQFVFQDPLGSLNPRQTIEQIIAEPAEIHRLYKSRAELREHSVRLLERVGLGAGALTRYPHEFSGGQCQRIGIARALITRPALLICDEAVSALDVTVQASILTLLSDLQKELSLGIVFISHDLAVVREVSDTVLVMYLGRVVEQGPAKAIYGSPRHPYTRALLAAVPVPDPAIERGRKRLVGAQDVPSPWNPAPGCSYHSRCPYVQPQCTRQRPKLDTVGDQTVACWRAREIDSPVDGHAI